MDQKQTIAALQSGAFDETLSQMYACTGEALAPYRQRFVDAILAFGEEFGEDSDISLFSAPGRTELCGNHTDHQGGRVLAAAVDMDIIAVAAKRDNDKLRLKSEGFLMDSVQLSDLAPQPDEQNSSASLLRGIASRFTEMGYEVTGFDAYTTSNVLRGSGLSSSAAFEVLVGNICSHFFADDAVDAVQIAQIGQYAENAYFGKPCGLMDQMASAVGGVIEIDFRDKAAPKITKTQVDLAAEGYALCILDSGANHADLTDAYAAIPAEMRAVARALGKERLSEVRYDDFYDQIPALRASCGDRAVLRALHYFGDDQRVTKAVRSLQNGYFQQYLEEIRISGASSFQYLQNVSTYASPRYQDVAIAIAAAGELLGSRGAVRVHGGGFAGTVQAYVPLDLLDEFREKTERILGEGACHVMRIRSIGGICLC